MFCNTQLWSYKSSPKTATKPDPDSPRDHHLASAAPAGPAYPMPTGTGGGVIGGASGYQQVIGSQYCPSSVSSTTGGGHHLHQRGGPMDYISGGAFSVHAPSVAAAGGGVGGLSCANGSLLPADLHPGAYAGMPMGE